MDEELDQLFETIEAQIVKDEAQVGGVPPMVAPPGVEHAGLQGIIQRQIGQNVPKDVVAEAICAARRSLLLAHSVEKAVGAA